MLTVVKCGPTFVVSKSTLNLVFELKNYLSQFMQNAISIFYPQFIDVKFCDYIMNKCAFYNEISDFWLGNFVHIGIFVQVASGGREIIPKWLFALIDKDTEQVSLSLKMHITPLLMQMKYKGFPLFHKRDSGWCFVVPNNNEKVIDLKSEGYKEVKLLMADFEKLGCSKKQFSCFKIPHASGN